MRKKNTFGHGFLAGLAVITIGLLSLGGGELP